jgi:hypothetical protein
VDARYAKKKKNLQTLSDLLGLSTHRRSCFQLRKNPPTRLNFTRAQRLGAKQDQTNCQPMITLARFHGLVDRLKVTLGDVCGGPTRFH